MITFVLILKFVIVEAVDLRCSAALHINGCVRICFRMLSVLDPPLFASRNILEIPAMTLFIEDSIVNLPCTHLISKQSKH